jgi:superfamily II DNA or RNA helicase
MERMNVDERKQEVQNKAIDALKLSKHPFTGLIRGIIAMATGSGKSKIVIDFIKKDYQQSKILLVVPTRKLRDNNWSDEFSKWNCDDIYNSLQRECYASINTIKDQDFDLVILDELQNITPNNYKFFTQNKVKDVIGLSATVPTETEKSILLDELDMKIVYTMKLDESVEKQLVSPYKIIKVEFSLDNVNKNVEAGTIKNRFMTTEQSNYDYLSRDIESAQQNPNITGKQLKFKYLKRMQFIYGLKSKEAVAKSVLKSIPENERTLIFAGTIDMAERLEPNTFHSKSSDNYLDLFMRKEINRLSCVKALNEGMNIPDIDNAIIVQVNSKERHLIQKIGRAVRFRENHTANIYIIYAKNTVDEKWVDQATKNLNLENTQILKYSIK